MIIDAVERYVASIRAAGYTFHKDARRLANYAAFAQARGDSHVKAQSVLEWTRRSSSALQRRRLVLLVRRFALTMAAEDPRHEAPPADIVPRAPRARPKPYIYSSAEVAALLAVWVIPRPTACSAGCSRAQVSQAQEKAGATRASTTCATPSRCARSKPAAPGGRGSPGTWSL